jgi:cytochrome c-type biogenesis protein CcmE
MFRDASGWDQPDRPNDGTGTKQTVTRKSRRLILIASCGAVLALAVGLILSAMSGSIVFFRSPTEVASQGVAPGTRFRLGGLVKDGSLQRGPDQTVAFAVTDTNATVQVTYRGLLPDLFREGQGVVTEGTLERGGLFRADTVLAKHDESYMPREVADALKAQGRWQEGKGKDGGKNGEAPPQAASAGGEKTLGPRSER